MNWTPTDEQVEKATIAAHDAHCPDRKCEPQTMGTYRESARAVLVAVGPHVAASALREFADGWVADLSAELVGRTMLKTAMHDRADVYMSQIEKEAGR